VYTNLSSLHPNKGTQCGGPMVNAYTVFNYVSDSHYREVL